MSEQLETSELTAFVKVADAGSVAGAARELGLPRATVSRRLARLEERLGTRLIHRTTRKLGLTHAGDELYHHARAIVLAVDAAAAAVRKDTGAPRGLLRLSVPPLQEGSVRHMLLAFAEQYPDVTLEVSITTRHEDLVASGIDLAWRAGTFSDSGLIARRLTTTDLRAAASPAYLAAAGTPRTVEDLSEHSCLLGFTRGERPATHWPQLDGGQVRVTGRLVSNDLMLLVDAAVAGMGIAMLPHLVVREQLERGALVPVLADTLGADTTVALVYPDRHLLKPAVRAFIDHAVAWSALHLK